MLITGKPQENNINDYIIVDNEMSREFQLNGFMPKYFDSELFYFIKEEDLLKFIERSDKS